MRLATLPCLIVFVALAGRSTLAMRQPQTSTPPSGAQKVSTTPTDAEAARARTLAAIKVDCKYAAAVAEPDPQKQEALLQQVVSCIDAKTKMADAKSKIAAEQAAQAKLREKEDQKLKSKVDLLLNKAAADSSLQAEVPAATTPAPPKVPTPPKTSASVDHASSVEVSSGFTPTGAPTQVSTTVGGKDAATTDSAAIDVGAHAQQSAYATPDACATGTGTAARATGQAILSVHRELLREQDVQDDFGYRLGKRFLVYQVTVTNASKDFQYEVGDISLDLGDVLGIQGASYADTTPAKRQASSETLEMLRGVPEKGQDLDPRNLTLHIVQGIGAVGAGVSGLTPFSGVMGSAMGNFNGAFIQAITGIAPDHTATQLNRLSDMAFTSNTLIGKLQTKTYAVFVPKSFVLTKNTMAAFHKDPRTLLNWLPLDQVNVCVDGILLQQVATTADPTFSVDVERVAPGSSIALSDATPSADIYFTSNGDTPTSASTKYSTAFSIAKLGDSLTLKAFALAPNIAPSNVVVRTFHAAPQANPPAFQSPDGKNLIMTGVPTTDLIYYTTDGTTPNAHSTLYTVPFPLDSTKKYTARAIGNATSFSDVATYPTAP